MRPNLITCLPVSKSSRAWCQSVHALFALSGRLHLEGNEGELGTCLNVAFLELNWNYHRTEAKEGKSCWVQYTTIPRRGGE